ncbi:hypothetical protein U3516DRAFT_734880 [Neocallimastix sp. 'constans']
MKSLGIRIIWLRQRFPKIIIREYKILGEFSPARSTNLLLTLIDNIIPNNKINLILSLKFFIFDPRQNIIPRHEEKHIWNFNSGNHRINIISTKRNQRTNTGQYIYSQQGFQKDPLPEEKSSDQSRKKKKNSKSFKNFHMNVPLFTFLSIIKFIFKIYIRTSGWIASNDELEKSLHQ